VREYSCPQCKNSFRASFTDGILSVVFFKNSNYDEGESQNEKMTIEHAYKIFQANQFTPWEQIELTRRKLIQQYHPDKVYSLGEKLRKVAESEGILINTAYELIKKYHNF
jgi:DnaJ like chaperone protein